MISEDEVNYHPPHQAVKCSTYRKTRILTAILCAIAVNFSYGYTIGINNSASQVIIKFANQSFHERGDLMISDDLFTTLMSTAFPFGGIIGSMLVYTIISKHDQLKCLFVTQIFNIILVIFVFLFFIMSFPEALIVGRGFAGLLTGFGLGVGPVYVASISTNKIRGFVGSMFAVAIAIGSVSGNIIGLKEVLGRIDVICFVMLIPAIPSFIFLIYLLIVSRTSSYEALNSNEMNYKKRMSESSEMSGADDVIDDPMIRQSSSSCKQLQYISIYKLIGMKRLRYQLVAGCVIMTSSQLSGINGVQANLNKAFLAAGISPSFTYYASVMVAFVQFFSTFSGCFIALRYGRRHIILWGNFFVVISHLLYTVSYACQDANNWMPYISVAAMIGFVMSVNMGSGLVCYTITPELFPNYARPAAMTITVASFWISFTIVSFLTPVLYEYLKTVAMLPYSASACFTLFFVYFFVPETKSYTEGEIQHIFASIRDFPIRKIIFDRKIIREMKSLKTKLITTNNNCA